MVIRNIINTSFTGGEDRGQNDTKVPLSITVRIEEIHLLDLFRNFRENGRTRSESFYQSLYTFYIQQNPIQGHSTVRQL